EGSVWEAAMYAGFHKIDNLVAVVDYNKIQSFGRTKEVMDLEPLAKKWEAFRWGVQEIDGHNFGEILGALSKIPLEKGKPTCIIAHTVKGKGVSYMEDKLEWHYRSPTGDLRGKALEELEKQRI
ncbi:MAG: transketolase, partial [Patescibacteria group bacterium]